MSAAGRPEPGDAREAVVEAARRLRAGGCDAATVAGLFVNGAALLLSECLSEEEFVEMCRKSWRASERQAELCRLLDRAIGERRAESGERRARKPKSDRSRDSAVGAVSAEGGQTA